MQRDGQPAVDAGALRGLEVLQGATDFCLQREDLSMQNQSQDRRMLCLAALTVQFV